MALFCKYCRAELHIPKEVGKAFVTKGTKEPHTCPGKEQAKEAKS